MSQSSHKWIKVWTTILTDPDIDNTSLDNIGRWVKLLLYVKMHGEGGILKIAEPAKTFCFHMQVNDVNEFKNIAEKLPNIEVSCNGKNGVTVFTVKNWSKYQIDDSKERVEKFRLCNATREEKKREEKNKNKRREEKNTRAVFLLPEWIDKNLWNDFTEMRKKNRKPMTDRAMDLAVKDLENLKKAGNDPVEVLNRSILNGWSGLYELKNKRVVEYL